MTTPTEARAITLETIGAAMRAFKASIKEGDFSRTHSFEMTLQTDGAGEDFVQLTCYVIDAFQEALSSSNQKGVGILHARFDSAGLHLPTIMPREMREVHTLVAKGALAAEEAKAMHSIAAREYAARLIADNAKFAGLLTNMQAEFRGEGK